MLSADRLDVAGLSSPDGRNGAGPGSRARTPAAVSLTLTAIAAALAVLVVLCAVWLRSGDARWVPASHGTVRSMLELSGAGPDTLVYDLGSGDGRVLFAAARDFGARAVGVEINPLRWLLTQLFISRHRLRGRVTVRLGSLFDQDLRPADVVTCYLSPAANRRLEGKLTRELAPGTLVVSYRFGFVHLPIVSRDEQAGLTVYRIGGTAATPPAV